MSKFFRRTSVRALTLAGVLGAFVTSQAAADGTAQEVASTSDGYCHLKIPAMPPSTLATGTPELKSSTTGDLIDFYGPCNYDPRSKEEVAMQTKFRSLNYGNFSAGSEQLRTRYRSSWRALPHPLHDERPLCSAQSRQIRPDFRRSCPRGKPVIVYGVA